MSVLCIWGRFLQDFFDARQKNLARNLSPIRFHYFEQEPESLTISQLFIVFERKKRFFTELGYRYKNMQRHQNQFFKHALA